MKRKPLNTKKFPFWELKYRKHQPCGQDLRGVFEKVSVLLDCCTVSSEEFVAVDDDNAYAAPIMADKDILEFVQSSKDVIVAGSEDENEINNADLVPTPSEMRNIIKSMHNYLDTHSNGEMNNKMDDTKQSLDNLMQKKDNARKSTRLFSKNNKCFVFLKN
ncbi:hypothetical protein TNCV_622591 [Trichonephila clavipes]|nr:hypothetical protein TNCV_622591 [Trichonephila clavipes]